MSFFKDFKEDFKEAMNELMPDGNEMFDGLDDDDELDTLEDELVLPKKAKKTSKNSKTTKKNKKNSINTPNIPVFGKSQPKESTNEIEELLDMTIGDDMSLDDIAPEDMMDQIDEVLNQELYGEDDLSSLPDDMEVNTMDDEMSVQQLIDQLEASEPMTEENITIEKDEKDLSLNQVVAEEMSSVQKNSSNSEYQKESLDDMLNRIAADDTVYSDHEETLEEIPDNADLTSLGQTPETVGTNLDDILDEIQGAESIPSSEDEKIIPEESYEDNKDADASEDGKLNIAEYEESNAADTTVEDVLESENDKLGDEEALISEAEKNEEVSQEDEQAIEDALMNTDVEALLNQVNEKLNEAEEEFNASLNQDVASKHSDDEHQQMEATKFADSDSNEASEIQDDMRSVEDMLSALSEEILDSAEDGTDNQNPNLQEDSNDLETMDNIEQGNDVELEQVQENLEENNVMEENENNSASVEETTTEVSDKKPEEQPKKKDIMKDKHFDPSTADTETTYITKGTVIKGDLETDGSIDIIGQIEGNVTCQGKVVVGGVVKGDVIAGELYANNAKIEGAVTSYGSVKVGVGSVIIGNIESESAVIAGAVNGDLDVKGPVIVDSTAVIMGNIKSRSVQINNGAVIEGFCSQSYSDIDVKSFFA